ncbi:hypothetical protein CZ794_01335 [Psychrobacter sp. JB385]|nr:hypothetical protein CZ794_01335 [Psychrobacter sp. JB385]
MQKLGAQWHNSSMRRKRHYHNKQWHTDDRKKASIFFAKILAIKILASSAINTIT